MEKIIKYKTIVERYRNVLDDKVNAEIAKGWQPQEGGFQMTETIFSYNFAQVMVKFADDNHID